MTADSSDQPSREQQIRRVNNEMRKVLVSQPGERDQREEAYRRARVATEMKAGLEGLIEGYEADARLRKRREHTLGDRPRR